MRVAFFTAGTHGAGHHVRGMAIGRALARAGFRGTYRMFAPESPFSAAPLSAEPPPRRRGGPDRPEGWERIVVEEARLRDPATARETALARDLTAFRPDLLIVDMFWAPLRWILPLPACEAWLLLRSFPPPWLVGPRGLPFEASQFDRIIAIEPVEHAFITHRIDPIVIANPDECRPRGALRRRLEIPEGRTLIGVAHGGNPGECRQLAPAMGPEDVVVMFDLFQNDAIFPVAEWLGDCDRLHAGAGYNTYWEARWLGYATRTTFMPFQRKNDDHVWRLAHGASHRMFTNGADTLASFL